MSGPRGRRRRVVIGTAGHIDHGKTALVKELTGTDTDRLPEERRRGISIDLGFAPLALGAGAPIASVVDVPGHEAFIKNMVAGASGIDAALLVVAADEGVMPQTLEHMTVLEALGVHHAVVAVTKVDLVDAEFAELVAETVREAIGRTSLRGSEIVLVSAQTGVGVEALRAELRSLAIAASSRPSGPIARLAVDRAFTVVGVGTVATGTLRGGSLSVGQEVEVLPGGERVRLRSIEIHGESVQTADEGGRTAMALAGAGVGAVKRGVTLVEPDSGLRALRRYDVRLWLAGHAPRPVRSGHRLRFHQGTAEVLGRIRWYGKSIVEPGEAAYGRLVLEAPLAAIVDDRLVVRAYSPVTTIGGVEVLARNPRRVRGVDAEKRADWLAASRSATPAERVELVLRDAGTSGVERRRLGLDTGLDADTVARLTGPQSESAVRIGERVFAPDAIEDAARSIVEAVEGYHARHPLEPGMPLALVRGQVRSPDVGFIEAAIDRAVERGWLERRGAVLAGRAHVIDPSADERERIEALLACYAEVGLEAPDTAGVAARLGWDEKRVRELQHYLEREGRLLKIASDWYLDAEALGRAREVIVKAIERTGGLEVGGAKALLGVSRKYLIPILEYLDRSGVTARRGNKRILAS